MIRKIKNLTNDEFDRLVEPIIIGVSSIISLIVFGILLFFGFKYSLSFLICFSLSILIFIKNNFFLTNFLFVRIFNPKFWMIVNNIFNTILYMGVALLLYKVPYFSLVGLIGLFMVAIATIIVSLIHDVK